MRPETMWAVRSAPPGFRETFHCVEDVALGVGFVSVDESMDFMIRVTRHFFEYPGALTLVEMSGIEKELADEYDRRSGGRDKVIFSWRRLPGVLD